MVMGDLDIFTTGGTPGFFVNDGSGNLTYDTSIPPAGISSGLYTAELIDVDGNGFYDLLVSGHEWELDTAIYWGSADANFTASNRSVLPPVPGFGVVIDIDAEDIDGDGNRDVILTRSGGTGSSPDPTFYVGYQLQILMSDGNRGFVDETSTRFTFNNDTGEWIVWIRLQDVNNDGSIDILVNDRARGLVWVNNGNGVFSPF